MKWFLILLFSLTSFSILSQPKIDTCITPFENLKKNINPAYKYGSLIPRDIDEAIIILLHRPSKSLNRFINLEKQEALRNGLFGHGANLNHTWRLHQESILTAYFNKKGIYSYKTMQSIILDLLYTYLTEEKYKLDDKIEYYKVLNKKLEKKAKKSHKLKTKELIKARKKIKKVNDKKSKTRIKTGDPNPLLIN